MKTKKRIKIGIATTFVIVILMSLCGSRFVFQKACVRRETSWLNMGTADDYIYNLLVDAYNIRNDIVNIGLHFILKNVRPYAAPCSEA